eukprot:6178511-Pleurochrysis_carterae.AAC.1
MRDYFYVKLGPPYIYQLLSAGEQYFDRFLLAAVSYPRSPDWRTFHVAFLSICTWCSTTTAESYFLDHALSDLHLARCIENALNGVSGRSAGNLSPR